MTERVFTEYPESEFLTLSGLQHFVFCKRQWALLFLEDQWSDNARTIEGTLFHERAHDSCFSAKRKDVIETHGMPVFSKTLGLRGVCDVVEFINDEKDGVHLSGREGRHTPYPVEYKKGAPRSDDADRLQLAAQAICLEEMLCCDIPCAYIYYGAVRRREAVPLTEELRDAVYEYAAGMHELFKRRRTPKVRRKKACNACSVKNLCLPQMLNLSAKKYIAAHIDEEAD